MRRDNEGGIYIYIYFLLTLKQIERSVYYSVLADQNKDFAMVFKQLGYGAKYTKDLTIKYQLLIAYWPSFSGNERLFECSYIQYWIQNMMLRYPMS